MISIIVPVYNTGKYLKECLDSLLAQTYSDIEIIIVDDGSTDDSYLVCKEYEKKDHRIKTYHKENSGVSATRNYGIDHANGEYISFCDSDDKVVPQLYQILLDIMNDNDVDRVVGGYMYFYDDGHTLYSKPRVQDGRYEADVILSRMIDDGTLSGFLFSGVNNSLFRKSIINECCIRFDSGIRYNEDSLFSLEYMIHSKAVYSLQSHATYFYRQHDTSSTKKRSVGDKYGPLRNALYSMKLAEMDIDFERQMKRRTVTEALWQILDISAKEPRNIAIKEISRITNRKDLRVSLLEINPKSLNMYKRFYYTLIRLRLSRTLYFASNKLLPILSKYLSR